MSAIVIKDQVTHEEVHRIDTTGKSDREIEKVETGLAYKVDFDRFYWTTEA